MTWLDDKEPEHSRFNKMMEHVDKVVSWLGLVVGGLVIAYMIWLALSGR